MLSFILPFIVLILVVVFIHEYGHYYFAKKYGVGVTDFSIGFGREIFGWHDKSGTRWKISWLPLGGYVKFFGDRNVFSQSDQEKIIKKYNEEDRKKLFVLKPLYQRSLIVAAGPLANFVLAILIFFTINLFVGKDMTPAIIDEVQKDSPAFVAGMKKNDKIIYIDNKKVESIDMDATTAKSNEIQITILRDWIKAFDLYKVPMKTDIHIIAGTNPKLNCNNISSRTVIYAFVNSVPNINPTIATIATIAKMQATI